MKHFTLQYPGFGVEPAQCEVFVDEANRVAVAVERPDNKSTSVTNAVEQVYERLESRFGTGIAFYTVSPYDHSSRWGVYAVKIEAGRQPKWLRVKESWRPKVLARAVSWAEDEW